MTHGSHRNIPRLSCERLEPREVPSASMWIEETFDQTAPNTIPIGWSQWSNNGGPSFAVTSSRSNAGPHGIAANGRSNTTARTWLQTPIPNDFAVSVNVFLDSLQPLQLFARGSNLDSATPTYYAVSVTRGLNVELLKVVDGVATSLGSVQSKSYVSGKWAKVMLKPIGDSVSVELSLIDSGQYLTPNGQWQASPVEVLRVQDTAIGNGGLAGLNRPLGYSSTVVADTFTVYGAVTEKFDRTAIGALPAGWAKWTNDNTSGFGVSDSIAFSPSRSLVSSASTSNNTSRAWLTTSLPANIQVSGCILVDDLLQPQLMARGSKLDTATPTYYAVSVTRGLELRLLRVVDGKTTELARTNSLDYFSAKWVRVTLTVDGSVLRASVVRTDTGEYLNDQGKWQAKPARALEVSDSAITGGGFVGVVRPSRYAGRVEIDDFAVTASSGDTTSPNVTIALPANNAAVSGVVPVQATATDQFGVERVEFYTDGILRFSTSTAPYQWQLNTAGLRNGSHLLTVKAYDPSGNVAEATITIQTRNADAPDHPEIPRHYSHIRIAQLAYYGTPMTSFEQQLLRESVDLVIPHSKFLSTIASIAPDTPQLLYTNVSNLYLDLLTDWLVYADRTGADREDAFYHASSQTAFIGDSPSSLPVSWFWSVQRGGSKFTNLTSAARNSTVNDVAFGGAGESLYFGHLDRFREVNLTISTPAANGWTGLIEYATAVDAAGAPTGWKSLSVLSDRTNGFKQTGQITFDPPPDWRPAAVNGSPALYCLRVRTLTGGTAPVATTLLGRDYVGANGTTKGIIPAFDKAADTNNDGYLNDAEYARRAPRKDARFIHESRVFYPYYGQMRFATNPSDSDVQEWAADYHKRLMAANPLADGIFVDNSGGRSPVAGLPLVESSDTYGVDYAALLTSVNRAIAPSWVAANTSGGGYDADVVVQSVPATVEEFALRPVSHSWQQFEDLAEMIQHRLALASPPTYVVLDSLAPSGFSPTDPRWQLSTLAYYYLIGDAENTFLMFNGGNEPASSWTRHWTQAAAFDVGAAKGAWSVFAKGVDPTNTALSFSIYQREYANALVLYKPLSYTRAVGTGTTADNTATTHQLNGTYRVLRADGTLSAPVTSVTLRNGEGAILVKG